MRTIMTRIFQANKSGVLEKAVEALKNGEIIIYPTDTLYGLGCDATNHDSIEKLFKLKNRDTNKPVSILLPYFESIEIYAKVTEIAKNVFSSSKEPTTVVMESKIGALPKILNTKDDSIAIRIPQEGFSLELAKEFNKPITATSANLSGKKLESFEKMLIDFSEISTVIRDEDIEKNTKASKIVDIRRRELKIIRN